MTTAAAQQVRTEVANGHKYLIAVYRGTEYSLHQGAFGWELTTRRIGYGGRFHIGGFKRFDSITAVAAGCKAFGPAEKIASMAYGI